VFCNVVELGAYDRQMDRWTDGLQCYLMPSTIARGRNMQMFIHAGRV